MNKNKDKGFSNPRNDETRRDDEDVSDFLDRIYGKNRTKYTATYNPRFGRYGPR